MFKVVVGGSAIAALLLPIAAAAAPRDVLQPIQSAAESVRFDRGEYVVDAQGSRAAVQLRSVTEHGSTSFDVFILNTGFAPINVDVSDIQIDGTEEPVRVLTRAELEHNAEHRARWQKFWSVVGTGLIAAGQASARNYYHVTTATPYGVIRSGISTPCTSCQLAASYTLAAGSTRIGRIQETLDQTRAAIGAQAFQLSTINPGQAYGGRIFLTRFKHQAGENIRMTVNVDGEPFAFGFHFVPEGGPTPSYRIAAFATPSTSAPNASYALAQTPPVGQPAVFTRSIPQPVFRAANMNVGSNMVAPSTMNVQSTIPAVGYGLSQKWHRYHAMLMENGISRSQAKQMADEEFGPID